MKRPLPTYEELLKPLPVFSLSWFKWKMVAWTLRNMGRLSEGIRIGLRHGFDSGQMLDYVYQNEPRGSWSLGKAIDKAYLNGPGWAGIRQRKAHLKQLVKEVIASNSSVGKKTVVMDVASGPGRYLLEVLKETAPGEAEVICRDLNENGLAQGRALAKEWGLSSIKYEKADAFSPQDLKKASPRPNLIIVSGLYELFTDDDVIKRSMRDIFRTLAGGDSYIFTNQPFHPQLELIARTLPNREGKLWVMKLRTDEQVRSWAREAGFEVGKSLIDAAGIFSVTLAKKV